MTPADLPTNEAARLQALFEYDILDTESDEAFDQLTDLASSICGTPIALVSLIDEKRQWFKSHHGLDAQETPRDIAFCAHAIHSDSLFEVRDSRKDERFADNPLVTDEPKVIFYAGAPLITPSGERIGTLCVIDNKPSSLSELQKQQLTIIAKQVVGQLELRKNSRLKSQVVKELNALTEKYESQQHVLQKSNIDMQTFCASLSHDFNGHIRRINQITHMLHRDLDKRITLSDKDKQLFSYIEDGASGLHELVISLRGFLSIDYEEAPFEDVDLKTLITTVEESLHQASEKTFDCVIDIDAQKIQGNHGQLIILFQNLLTNGIKYNTEKPTIHIHTQLNSAKDRVEIHVKDNGIGIDKKYFEQIFTPFRRLHRSDEYTGSGLGLSIVKRIIERHRGHLTIESTLGEGSTFIISLPYP
jgi:signal transduction histidine kinase